MIDLDAAGRQLTDELIAEYEHLVTAPLDENLRPLRHDEMQRLSEIAEILYHATLRTTDLSDRFEQILNNVLAQLPE